MRGHYTHPILVKNSEFDSYRLNNVFDNKTGESPFGVPWGWGGVRCFMVNIFRVYTFFTSKR